MNGGTWEYDEADGGVSVGRLVDPDPPPAGPFHRRLGGDFNSNPGGWHDTVGKRYNVVRYKPTADNARKLFERFRDLPEEADHFGGCTPSPPADLVDALLALLTRYGPFGHVAGVLEVGDEPDPNPSAAVPLNRYYLEGRSLSEDFFLVANGQRKSFGARVWPDRPREVSVIWGVRADRFFLEAQPLTLRAFLWQQIMQQHNRPAENYCRYCKERFEIPAERGRPPLYCDRHRTSKYRKRYDRGRAEIHLAAHPEEGLR